MPKVLVIDDDPDLRDMLRFLLSQSKHEVVEAIDGLDGLRAAWQQQPDIILLDVMMPTLDGHQVLHRLKSLPETASIPVIVLTAVSTAKHVRSLIAAGAADYVVKPFEPQMLLERLSRTLESSSGKTGIVSPRRVVVAAPNDWRRERLVRMLCHDFDVVSTMDGFEAMEMATDSDVLAVFVADGIDSLVSTDLAMRLRQNLQIAHHYLIALTDSFDDPEQQRELLAAGFDYVLPLVPSREQLSIVTRPMTRSHSAYARVRDGVVVVAVTAGSGKEAVERIHDAIVDYQEAGYTRFVVDLGYISNAASALQVLIPYFIHLVRQGILLRVVGSEALQAQARQHEDFPDVYLSVKDAIDSW